MIVARLTLHGEEHLAIALSAENREELLNGAITSIDLERLLAEHLDLSMAFEKRTTRIAIMTEEALAQRIAGDETLTKSRPE